MVHLKIYIPLKTLGYCNLLSFDLGVAIAVQGMEELAAVARDLDTSVTAHIEIFMLVC